jgi:Type II secretion system (T2SS), protein F
MDEETCEDNNMNFVLEIFVAVQISLLALLLLNRLSNYQMQRVNYSRRIFLDNFVASIKDAPKLYSQEDLTARTGLINAFLRTSYGRWFNRICLRSGKWDLREVSSLVGRKFEFALAGFILAFLLFQISDSSSSLLILFPLVGFLAPDYQVYSAGEKRAMEIARALPETIDLLNMTVGAGLGFQAGLDRIARSQSNPLSDEFRRVLAEIRLGENRARAFTAMAERINRPEIWSFTNAIAQVEKLGIPITKALQDQAKTIRAERREKAREKAQKLPVKILAPIMVFLLPAVLVIVLAPAIFTMFRAF